MGERGRVGGGGTEAGPDRESSLSLRRGGRAWGGLGRALGRGPGRRGGWQVVPGSVRGRGERGGKKTLGGSGRASKGGREGRGTRGERVGEREDTHTHTLSLSLSLKKLPPPRIEAATSTHRRNCRPPLNDVVLCPWRWLQPQCDRHGRAPGHPSHDILPRECLKWSPSLSPPPVSFLMFLFLLLSCA